MRFGLAASKEASKVEVRWPTGKSQVLTSVAADRVVEVTEEVAP